MTVSLFQLHLIIHGSVQGVSFRWFLQREARELGLTGWVRNKLDSTVEVLAEGSKEILEKFKIECAKGPAWASVTEVEDEWKKISQKNFNDFMITY